ncbi:MAG: hypothetical protein PHI35_03400, partial [Victivallaceae bacterium]|nr:hypothetical protein [Victivallaceae bacterium]
ETLSLKTENLTKSLFQNRQNPDFSTQKTAGHISFLKNYGISVRFDGSWPQNRGGTEPDYLVDYAKVDFSI